MNVSGIQTITLTDAKNAALTGLKIYGLSDGGYHGGETDWIQNVGDSGSINFTIQAGGTEKTFSVPTPTGHVGLILGNGGNYQIDGVGVLGNVIDFGTGKNTAYVNKEIIVNTPNFVGAPLNAEDTRPHAVWDNAVGNTYKDHTHGALYSFAHYQNPEDEPDDFEGTYICLNGNQIEGYIPEAMSIAGMTSDILASALNAEFTEGQAGAIPLYFIGQLANPVESNISADLMEAFSQLTTSEGTTVITADQMVYFEVEYQKIGEDPEPEPEPEPTPVETTYLPEVILHIVALAGQLSVGNLPDPTCRVSHLLRKILDPSYAFPEGFSEEAQSRAEVYLFDLVNGTSESATMMPLSDFENYLALILGRTDIREPNPEANDLNYWMNQWLLTV